MKRLLLLALVLAGCALFSAQRREQARRAAAEAAALKAQVVRALEGLERPLKAKLWDSLVPLYFRGDPGSFRALKTRTEALWKRGQLLDLGFDVRKVRREKDVAVALVRWERSLLERGMVQKEEGKCEVVFKRSESGLLLFSADRDGCFF